jgi:hypothetical protein
MKQLLLKCAENLDNGCDPMHHTFLVENNVSADECFALSQQMAVAIRGYAQAPLDIALRIVMCSEFKDPVELKTILDNLERAQAQKSVLEKLRKI